MISTFLSTKLKAKKDHKGDKKTKKIKSNFDYMLDYNALIDKAEKNGYKIELIGL